MVDEHSKRTVSPIPDMLLITSSTSSFSSVTRLELWEKKVTSTPLIPPSSSPGMELPLIVTILACIADRSIQAN